ncbi:MAG: RNA methyltransferase [Chloroflexi bacterium]|nr:RNA methyltransferase [Chloroflexota bacterium]
MITSLQNPKVKLVYALQTQARARRKHNKLALEGLRLIHDALARGQMMPELFLYDPEVFTDAAALDDLRGQGAEILAVAPEVLRHISGTEHPQGVIGVFPLPRADLPDQPDTVLILDQIRDPGNLGTILRTAAAAGIGAVLLAPGCVDVHNPKVLRGAMGAHFRVPTVERDWAAISDYCAGCALYLADHPGEVRYDAVDWSGRWALIIGSEAHGASAEAEQLAAARIYIPMAAGAESLNAAVAAGVILFEARRAYWG